MTAGLRADARANHEKLLDVAAQIFAREGADTSLKAIAAEAGVGIGTLYRRFPNREDLIEATYRKETSRLCASAGTLVTQPDPLGALREWMEHFVDYMLTKRGMSDALPSILASREGLRAHSRAALNDAMELLLEAGKRAGDVRADADPNVVVMALGGITLISDHEHQRTLASQLIALLIDGLVATRTGESN
jgi:AcrR family transcriptional regulator